MNVIKAHFSKEYRAKITAFKHIDKQYKGKIIHSETRRRRHTSNSKLGSAKSATQDSRVHKAFVLLPSKPNA